MSNQTSRVELQTEVQRWWELCPMTYDWRSTNDHDEGTQEWFEEIDRRFFSEVSSSFAQSHGAKPFSRLIPYNILRGREVLEIGCGSGAHAKLIAESGARLTAIDLTEKAVALTRQRLRLYELAANVLQMDAESLSFPDRSFDFVWSWGVIHHSANTETIIREVARVLRPGGSVGIMVYNWHSIVMILTLIRGLLSGRFLSHGITETLNHYSDGRVARFFSPREFADFFKTHFENIDISIFGQTNELVPLPGWWILGKLKASIADAIPRRLAHRLLSHAGSFLFLTAEKK